jgi:hypothetical protein
MRDVSSGHQPVNHHATLGIGKVAPGGVLLGNGDGTFQSRIDYAIGNGPSGTTMVAGDFNGDGREDLAVVGSAGLMILLGNGDGTFQPTASQNGLAHLRAVADFNNDGKLDLLVDSGIVRCGSGLPIRFCGAPVGVMLGNGDGTFKPPSIFNGGSFTLSALAADFDGDGNVDVGVVDGNNLQIYLGDGKGGFGSATPFPLRAAGTNGLIVSAVAADFSGDNAPDIAGPNAGAAYVGVSVNNTGAAFSLSASAATPSTIGPGQSAASTITIELRSSFKDPVSLTCAVQPTQPGAPTCSLSSSSITFGAKGNATATLSIGAGSPVAAEHSSVQDLAFRMLPFPVGAFVLFGEVLGQDASRKKRLLRRLLGLALFCGLISLIACGGKRRIECSDLCGDGYG